MTADELRELRLSKHWPLRKVAEICEVSISTVYAWERGKYPIKEKDALIIKLKSSQEPKVTPFNRPYQWTPEIIKGLRTHLGMTQEQFSKRLGVSRVTVSNLEKGKGRPSIGTTDELELIRKEIQR